MSDLVGIGWSGLDGPGAEEATLTIAETWTQAAEPLIVHDDESRLIAKVTQTQVVLG